MASIDEHGARWYSQSVPPPDDDTESSIELMSNTIAPAQKFTLTLSLIHLVILTQRSRILRCLIENLQENLTWEHEVYSWIELNKCRVELSISLYQLSTYTTIVTQLDPTQLLKNSTRSNFSRYLLTNPQPTLLMKICGFLEQTVCIQQLNSIPKVFTFYFQVLRTEMP